MANELIDHACVMKLHKKPKGQGSQHFCSGDLVEIWGQWRLERAGQLHPSHTWPYPSYVLYNKLVI